MHSTKRGKLKICKTFYRSIEPNKRIFPREKKEFVNS